MLSYGILRPEQTLHVGGSGAAKGRSAEHFSFGLPKRLFVHFELVMMTFDINQKTGIWCDYKKMEMFHLCQQSHVEPRELDQVNRLKG